MIWSHIAKGEHVIYNTEVFEVSDVTEFKQALESLRDELTNAGGTDIRLYRHVDEPNKVLAAMWWPDAETCRAFGRDHEQDFEATLGPHLTSMQPEELWKEL